jgi:hypothetical protein
MLIPESMSPLSACTKYSTCALPGAPTAWDHAAKSKNHESRGGRGGVIFTAASDYRRRYSDNDVLIALLSMHVIEFPDTRDSPVSWDLMGLNMVYTC